MDLGAERHAGLQREIARSQLAQDRLHAARLDLGEKAHLAEVDAQERHVDLRHGPSGPQEGSVAAQHDQRARSRKLANDGLRLPGRRGPVGNASHLAPAFGPFTQVQGRLFGWVVGEADAFELHMPASSPNLSDHSEGRSTGTGSTGW